MNAEMRSTGKTALITGITGQGGSHLAELLLEKGYSVHSNKRRASSFNTIRIDHLYQAPHELEQRMWSHDSDLTDSTSLIRIIQQVHPDEIDNLGAQSHVAVSFEAPEYTTNSDALGTLRILEGVRMLGFTSKTRFFQASPWSSDVLVQDIPQKEATPFYPDSPHGVVKLYACRITVNDCEAYGMYACKGILFNHESPRRGETFVTGMITRALARINEGLNKGFEDCHYLENLDSLRDWGHARDDLEIQSRMLQQEGPPEDFVIATGRQESVRRSIEFTAVQMGWGSISGEGEGIHQRGRRTTGQVVVGIDPCCFRPADVETLSGDPTKAHETLAWTPSSTLGHLGKIVEPLADARLDVSTHLGGDPPADRSAPMHQMNGIAVGVMGPRLEITGLGPPPERRLGLERALGHPKRGQSRGCPSASSSASVSAFSSSFAAGNVTPPARTQALRRGQGSSGVIRRAQGLPLLAPRTLPPVGVEVIRREKWVSASRPCTKRSARRLGPASSMGEGSNQRHSRQSVDQAGGLH